MNPVLSRLQPVNGFFDGWGPLWDVVTGAEQERGEQLNQAIIRENEFRTQIGYWDPMDEYLANEEFLNSTDDPSTYGSQVATAAGEGAVEGLHTMQSGLNAATNALVRETFNFIPTWVKVAGVVGALYYLGAFDGLKGSLGKGSYARRKLLT